MGMLIAVLIAATVIGVVELWPHGQAGKPQGFGPTRTDGATVTRVSRVSCGGSGAHGCQRVDVKLTSGPNSGRTTHFTIVGQVGAIVLAAGDHIRVYPNRLPPGAVNAAGHKLDPYSFSDFDRRSAMLWLAVGFVVLLL